MVRSGRLGFSAVVRFATVALLAVGLPMSAYGAVQEAEVIFLTGQAQKKQAELAPWTATAIKERIQAGGYVKTLANSQIGLMLPDRNPLRLSQNSQMQIKSMDDTRQWMQTTIRLDAGRAWSNARPQAAPNAAGQATGRVVMETPSATLAIRGTDWEVEVRPDGSVLLVVVSGRVQMSNALGVLQVDAGQAALAEKNKAPARLELVNPRDRVQWVSSWQAQPRRWAAKADTDADGRYGPTVARMEAGDWDAALRGLQAGMERHEPGALALAADVLLARGDVTQAIALLAQAPDTTASDGVLLALQARALARADRVGDARNGLAHLPEVVAHHPEVQLAQGELALLDGDWQAGQKAFLEVLAHDPGIARAWYGLGVIHAERGNFQAAQEALQTALKGDALFLPARIELAHVAMLMDDFQQAQSQLDAVLAVAPSDYLALTASGFNKLRAGRPSAAMDDFLKSGIIEPRYARNALYSGIAFYQLGELPRALEAVRRAAELDQHDPLPHLFESLMQSDDRAFFEAIESAQAAQIRLPFLKSLNPVMTNQRGLGSVGGALAAFGMEEWAGWYAQRAHSPFTAASQLFYADRQTETFSKSSNLMMGFLTDPTVFGASNRSSTLLPSPGHYGSVEGFYQSDEWRQEMVVGAVNGLVVSPIPMAYSVTADWPRLRSGTTASDLGSRNVVVGLGLKPQHDVGIFGYHTASSADGGVWSAQLLDGRLDFANTRTDAGINLKLAAQNQVWLKFGREGQSNAMRGGLRSPELVHVLNAEFGVSVYDEVGRLEKSLTTSDQSDVQFRHSFVTAAQTYNWGLERASRMGESSLVARFGPIPERVQLGLLTQLDATQRTTLGSTDLYFGGRWQGGVMALAADAWWQYSGVERVESTTKVTQIQGFSLGPQKLNQTRADSLVEWNPRLGAQWSVNPTSQVTGVLQRWRRPASANSLGDTHTLGIAIDDALVQPGGLWSRARLQWDAELNARRHVQVFVDHEVVDNGILGQLSSVPTIEIPGLERLRSRRELFAPMAEFEERLVFTSGRVDTLGWAVNALVDSKRSVTVRYRYRDQAQTGVNAGLSIPYVPRHSLLVGGAWALPKRWLLTAAANYRSDRYRDAANTDAVSAGWSLAWMLHWESADKRLYFQAAMENLWGTGVAPIAKVPKTVVQLGYRF